MDNATKGVHRLPVDQDFEFHQIVGPISAVFVIHRTITAGNAFDPIAKINQNLAQRNLGGQHDPLGIQ